MKIKLKPLKGDSFEVEAADEDSVIDLKKKVGETRAEFPAEGQKLIYAGKILKDESKISEIGFKQGDFIVVMASKVAAPKAKAAPAATPAAEQSTPAPAPAAAPTEPAAGDTASANRVTGAGSEAAIQQLCDMGFARPEVERCLAAAFGNPDRAVEYLMSGIPDGLMEPAGGAPPAAPPAAGGAPPAAGGDPNAFPDMAMAGGGGERVELPPALAALRDNPQFEQLAAMVAQNPAMLEQMLPAIAQTNPEVVQAIREHPDAFTQMLQDVLGGGDDDEDEDDPVAAMMAAAGQGGGGGGGGGMPQGVQLTEAENAAVERLMALGFERATCVQAYFACDKNEELAANFLFESGGDMMQD